MQILRPRSIGITICIYCMWQSENLINAWLYSPYDRFGWITFITWCMPLVFFWGRQSKIPDPPPEGRPLFLGLGLLFSFHGVAGSMHALEYIGLAFALAGLMPSLKWGIIWIGSSVSWMPVLGWLSGRFFPEYILLFRFLLCTIPVVLVMFEIRNLPRRQCE